MRTVRTITLLAVATVALTLVVALAGCSSNDSTTCTVTGTILHDSDHRPLAGVRVTDNVVQTTTGRDGTFTLQVTHDGDATLYVLADGYEVAQGPIPIGTGTKELGAIYLKPVVLPGYGLVTGIVARAGQPVYGADVWVGGNRGATHRDGHYRLYNIPAGQQTVTASVGGVSGTASVMVISERTVTADISVTTGPPAGPF
ncbi:MAG: carboxypeptidase-like regulatory domain-containing protein [candidate division WS1 bacterium]|nr:carboxypeptidase-like regulatory domain-containing protein [candidate division WS1 bacterium]